MLNQFVEISNRFGCPNALGPYMRVDYYFIASEGYVRKYEALIKTKRLKEAAILLEEYMGLYEAYIINNDWDRLDSISLDAVTTSATDTVLPSGKSTHNRKEVGR